MGLDSYCLAALAHELREELTGARVDKVYQPERDEVVLLMHGRRDNHRLFFSAEPGRGRVHLTAHQRENPAQPPMLCMLLRKHLTGGKLVDIIQPEGERILRFTFDCINDLGDPVGRHLILEAMGPAANLILTDGEDRILACTRRVEGDLAAGKRQVMPGSLYRLPEPHPGLPPLLRRELEFRGKTDVEALTERPTPTLLKVDGKPKDFSFCSILQYGPASENVTYPSFSALLDDFYAKDRTERRAGQRGSELLKTVESLRERAVRKKANQEQELIKARDREGLRVMGDLLTSNLYRLEKGLTHVKLENYYDPSGGVLDVPLDPLLTPQQNAAKYYKAYTKAKTAEEMLTAQLQKGAQEISYLESVAQSIRLAEGDRDLNEIRQELEEGGYLRSKKAARRQMKAASKPLEFRTAAGLRVSVGKNNAQNDRLTTKLAAKTDLWLHTQKVHGSHVILHTDGADPDPQSLLEAAGLAAYYSQARDSDKVAVDYTPVKYVKKPANAKPGMVVYTTYQTVLVAPKKP